MAGRLSFLILSCLAFAPSASADVGLLLVPTPANSSVPAVIVGSPDGTFLANIIVRDNYNHAMDHVGVVLDFGRCSAFAPCPSPCTGCVPSQLPSSVFKFTDSSGLVTFDLRVGGSKCPPPPNLQVYADGVPFGSPSFVSVDLDGDLSVTPGDVAIAAGLQGTPDARADFDGDGVVTAADVAVVSAHLGATCSRPVPAERRSWGRLKVAYR